MAVELIDTHCHLTSRELLPRREAVVAEAVAAGVTRMITVACTPAEAEVVFGVPELGEHVWAAVGVHPHEAGRLDPGEIETLPALWRRPGVVAAGEMGLDYHYDFSPRDVQQSVFKRQLDLAAETDLPLVIHAREAHDDIVRLLLAHGYAGRPVVFHCFSGDADEAAELWSHGWRTSFTGIVTFRKATAVRQAMLASPRDQLMFETDAPYLSPEPVRRMRPNEPKNVAHTIRFAAEALGVPFELLARTTTANALRFFRLDPPDRANGFEDG